MGVFLLILRGELRPFSVLLLTAQRLFAQPELFLILISCCCGIALTAMIARIKFELAAPLYMLASMLALYLFSIFGILSVGYYLVLGYNISGLMVLLICLFRPLLRTRMKEVLITPGALAFILLGLTIVFMNAASQVNAWDDFSHWAIAVKEIYRLKDLYVRPDSALAFARDYPPALSLIDYYGTRLLGRYSEPALFITQQLFSVAFVIPLFALIKRKARTSWLCLFCIVPLFAMIIPAQSQGFFDTLFVDIVLGLMCGFGFALVLTKQYRTGLRRILLCLVAIGLVLTKQTGLVMALIVAVSLVIYAFTSLRKDKAVFKRRILDILVFGLGLTFSYLSWSIYLMQFSERNAVRAVRQSVTSQAVLKFLFGVKLPYQIETIHNYLRALLSRPILMFPSISYALFCGMVVCIFIGTRIFKCLKRQDHMFLLTAIFSGLALGLYALFYGAAYVFSFVPSEAICLASYERYMLTILVAVGLFWLFSLLEFRDQESIAIPRIIRRVTGTCAIILLILALLFHTNYLRYLLNNDLRKEYAIENSSLFQQVKSDRDKVYLLFLGDSGLDDYRARYYLPELRQNPNESWWITSQSYRNEYDYNSTVYTAEAWSKALITGGYDYVYMGQWSDELAVDPSDTAPAPRSWDLKQEFIKSYGQLFEDPQDITPNSLFRIEKQGENKIVLVRVRSRQEQEH